MFGNDFGRRAQGLAVAVIGVNRRESAVASDVAVAVGRKENAA
jgi:hypothetical protein